MCIRYSRTSETLSVIKILAKLSATKKHITSYLGSMWLIFPRLVFHLLCSHELFHKASRKNFSTSMTLRPIRYSIFGHKNFILSGPIPRAFCEQICPEGDYSCPPRPGSPSSLINARSNGTSGYRHYQPNGVGENFHGFLAHEGGKIPGSPIVGGPPHSIGSQDCSPHPYSNVQVLFSYDHDPRASANLN